MVYLFSGHSSKEQGNEEKGTTEYSLAIKLMEKIKIDYCFSDYDLPQLDLIYKQLDFINNRCKKEDCSIILHFPKSTNKKINIPVVLYKEDDLEAFIYAMQLKEVMESQGITLQIVSNKEGDYRNNFFMKKSKSPVLILEPFFISYDNYKKEFSKTIYGLRRFMNETYKLCQKSAK